MANSVGGAGATERAEGFERRAAMAVPATGAARNVGIWSIEATAGMTGTGEVVT